LRCALLLEPIVDFAHAVWHSPASHTVRTSIYANGLTPEDSKELDERISPASRRPACPADQVVVLAGEYDRIAPPELLQKFAVGWGTPHYHCFRQGHVGYQLMRGAFREWSAHFAGPECALRKIQN
jgi:predicted alpha/beta hydrolase family esterase